MREFPKTGASIVFDITERIQDGTHFSPKSQFGNYLYITSKNIKRGKLDLSDVQYISRDDHDQIYRRCNVQRGDILLTKDGANTGNVAMNTLDEPFSLLSSVAFLRTKHSICSNHYLFQYIASEHCQKQIADLMTGNAITRLTLEKMNGLSATLPPLPEQQKIAAILTSVDEVVEKTEAQISKLQDLKKGMMQELLSKGIGHTEFKDSPVGRIPSEWTFCPLSDVAFVKGGKRMPAGRPFAEGRTSYPYLRVSDFKDGTVVMDALRYVLPEDREKIKRYTISKDDLYISIAGTLGLVGTVPTELDNAQLTENAAKIVFKRISDIDKRYFACLLQSDLCQRQFFRSKGTGGGVPKLALFRIENTLVPLPSKDEQRKIADLLESIDTRIREATLKQRVLQNLKKALMQDLLTGKVRVKVN